MVRQHAWTLQGSIADNQIAVGLVATFNGWAIVLPRVNTDGPTALHFSVREAGHLGEILLGQCPDRDHAKAL